jgi:hypothetical protein
VHAEYALRLRGILTEYGIEQVDYYP